jgi:lactate dehydrogenase-like 2-hydroxyacid dehydrogenase
MIDETALAEALSARVIAGAGLDVFEQEPFVPEALRAMPHLALTPHIGSATQEARATMARMVIANLEAHFAGRPLVTPVP